VCCHNVSVQGEEVVEENKLFKRKRSRREQGVEDFR
ncbi:hypothetical protein A2U01_0104470, partial [Trifolium medium]|nr:hypothetical protein [Trifolium medium]